MERGRPQRTRTQLGVELRCDEVRMALQLQDLHPASVVGSTDISEARGLELRDVGRVDLVPVPVPLVDRGGAVQLRGRRVRIDIDLVGTEAHRRAHEIDVDSNSTTAKLYGA